MHVHAVAVIEVVARALATVGEVGVEVALVFLEVVNYSSANSSQHLAVNSSSRSSQ